MQMYRRELVFLKCDEVTRRTGRLCKCVTVVDLNYSSLAKVLWPLGGGVGEL